MWWCMSHPEMMDVYLWDPSPNVHLTSTHANLNHQPQLPNYHSSSSSSTETCQKIHPSIMSKPKNWPDSFPYLRSPLHSKDLTPSQLTALRTKPNATMATVPASLTQTPSPLVKITAISNPSHPANGQHGLFATTNLKPGTFILPYLGRVHAGSASDPDSDYDLWLDRGADVAVDAAREGNEARFVNDYRGVRERPNAEFGTVWCERWGEICVGFWVLKGGRGVRRGEEVLVSYGKGFWEGRVEGNGGEVEEKEDEEDDEAKGEEIGKGVKEEDQKDKKLKVKGGKGEKENKKEKRNRKPGKR